MKTADFVKQSGCEWFVKADEEREITGGYVGDLLSWVMSRAKTGDGWITIMSNINTLAVASLCEVACVILADGVKPDSDVERTARQKEINIIGTQKPAFEIASVLSECLKGE